MASFAAETVFQLGPVPITNTTLNVLLVDGILVATALYIKRNVKLIPGFFQNVIESVVEVFDDLVKSIADKRASLIFPWFITFFFFILIANWSNLIPGIGAFGFFEPHDGKTEFIPLIRGSTSDINVTFALALVSVFATHIMSVQVLGWKEYISRYLSFNPIYLFVGVLEIISEFTKIISLSFRLFGNIYAGEVVLTTVAGIFAFLFPIPFLLLEIIVGLVQALVFSMLTMVFMSILTTSHKDH